MRSILLILIAGIIFSCGVKKDEVKTEIKSDSSDRQEEMRQRPRNERQEWQNAYFRVENDSPVLKAVFEDDGQGSFRCLKIYDSLSGELLQQINWKDIKRRSIYGDEDFPAAGISSDYYDLDEYRDLFVYGQAAHPPVYGLYFLYDRKKGKFVYRPDYDRMSSVSINREKGLIYSYEHSPSGGWTMEVYREKGGRIYLAEEESLRELENGKYRVTLRVRNRNGKMVTVIRRDTTGFTGPGRKYFEEEQ